jgi:hypothetical protein
MSEEDADVLDRDATMSRASHRERSAEGAHLRRSIGRRSAETRSHRPQIQAIRGGSRGVVNRCFASRRARFQLLCQRAHNR